MTKYNFKDIQLKNIGFSKDQELVYKSLLEKGFARASSLSTRTSLKRSTVYLVLKQLDELGLIKKRENNGSVTLFYPAHPRRLQEIMIQRKEKLESTQKELDLNIGTLVSQYNYLSGKPNIQFFEGIEGVKKLYKEILYEGKDILLIRSPLDKETTKLKKIVEDQITEQIKREIHTRVLIPKRTKDKNYSENLHLDWIDRRIISSENFNIPAQIIVFGNYVGITAYREDFTVTIIESRDVSQTLKALFEILWIQGKDFTVK